MVVHRADEEEAGLRHPLQDRPRGLEQLQDALPRDPVGDAEERETLFAQGMKAKVARGYHVLPRLWKTISDVAQGLKPYEDYTQKVQELESKNPISLRHLLAPKTVDESLQPELDKVDISVGEHSLPFLISSMSFGSRPRR
jgi:glutamate synthase (NADPH/NADH) large chain